jgi:hypothetical protein
MREPTPWARWLAYAARAFLLPPEQFWRLSLREWRSLTQSAEPAMSRQDFIALSARYPD